MKRPLAIERGADYSTQYPQGDIDLQSAYSLLNAVNVNSQNASITTLNTQDIIRLGIRREVLREFSDPELLICTSSMNSVFYSADKVEAQAGNISSTSQVLTVNGGTATSQDSSWVYYNLPDAATKVYARAQMLASANGIAYIEMCDGSSATLQNPPNRYEVSIVPYSGANELRLYKSISGAYSEIAHEDVDLNIDTYYTVEAFFDVSEHTLEVWRDGVKKFDASDSDITSIQSVRLRCYDNSATSLQYAKFKGPLVVIYE